MPNRSLYFGVPDYMRETERQMTSLRVHTGFIAFVHAVSCYG